MRSSRRDVLFGLIAAALFFLGVNALVGMVERAGWIDTHDQDDLVELVSAPLFELDGEVYRTTEYAQQALVHQSFRREKGDGLRVVVVGASFAQGAPYQMQLNGERSFRAPAGGMASFLRAELQRRIPDSLVEVINAGSGGAGSGRVRKIALEMLAHDPDVLVVSSCNNEGIVESGDWSEFLNEQPGYRALRKLLLDKSTVERAWYSPQDAGHQQLEVQLRDNLAGIAEAAQAAGVPVLLLTLPVNLGYPGFDPVPGVESSTGLMDGYPRLSGEQLRKPSSLEDLPSCSGGIALFQAGEIDASLPLLRDCALRPGNEGQLAAFVPSYLALAEVAGGPAEEWAEQALRLRWGDCLAEGMTRYRRGLWDGAVEGLLECHELGEALQWAGLVRWRQGRLEEARAMLRQSVELVPKNRCRPSFNGMIRELAQEQPGVQLVDLAAAAEDWAVDGLPGTDLFLDSCHMSWRGYAQVGQEVLSGLEELFPDRVPAGEPMDIEGLARELGLPLGGNVAQLEYLGRPAEAGTLQ